MSGGRSAETRVRDAYCLQLRRQGFTYVQISEQVQRQLNEAAALTGGATRTFSHVSAWRAVKRAIADLPADERYTQRLISEERLEDLYRQTMRILVQRHYVVALQSGRIVNGPDGVPLEDTAPKLAAIARLQSIEESRRKLLALDARPGGQTFTDADADALLEQLNSEDRQFLEADAEDQASV